MSNRWFRRFLALCPTAIAMLWVAGTMHFRGVALSAQEWATLVAAAFAMTAILQSLRGTRPPPALPANSNPVVLAAIAAAMLGVVALIVGGALELVMEIEYPTDASLALRGTWHAACAFGAAYCTFLLRLTEPRRGRSPGQPPRGVKRD